MISLYCILREISWLLSPSVSVPACCLSFRALISFPHTPCTIYHLLGAWQIGYWLHLRPCYAPNGNIRHIAVSCTLFHRQRVCFGLCHISCFRVFAFHRSRPFQTWISHLSGILTGFSQSLFLFVYIIQCLLVLERKGALAFFVALFQYCNTVSLQFTVSFKLPFTWLFGGTIRFIPVVCLGKRASNFFICVS